MPFPSSRSFFSTLSALEIVQDYGQLLAFVETYSDQRSGFELIQYTDISQIWGTSYQNHGMWAIDAMKANSATQSRGNIPQSTISPKPHHRIIGLLQPNISTSHNLKTCCFTQTTLADPDNIRACFQAGYKYDSCR